MTKFCSTRKKNVPKSLYLDSPSVTVYVRQKEQAIDCVPEGNPPLYTFYQWEHLSENGEHIRYIDGMSNGTLVLSNTTYMDTGVYICTVSNGVPDKSGQLQQQGSTMFIYSGNNFALLHLVIHI